MTLQPYFPFFFLSRGKLAAEGFEFKINFLQPAYGHTLICKSRIIQEGKQLLIGESEVFDQRSDKEVLAAKGLITLMAVPQSKIKPVPGSFFEK